MIVEAKIKKKKKKCTAILLYFGTQRSAKLSPTFSYAISAVPRSCLSSLGRGRRGVVGKRHPPSRCGCRAAGCPSIMRTSETCLCKHSGAAVDSGPKVLLKKACRSLDFSLPDTPSFRKDFSPLSKKALHSDGQTAARQEEVIGQEPQPFPEDAYPICGKQHDTLEKAARGLGTLRKYTRPVGTWFPVIVLGLISPVAVLGTPGELPLVSGGGCLRQEGSTLKEPGLPTFESSPGF